MTDDTAAPATRVVVAHDYLTQRGGAERVALSLAQGLNAERVVTALYAPEQTFAEFSELTVQPSTWRALRPFRTDPRRALPLLAHAWNRMSPVDADAVVCSSSGWAHALPTTSRTVKVVYCHNPARWLYQPEDYTAGLGLVPRAALAMLGPALRRWDRRAAATADAYVANSTSVARRIHAAYGIEASVIHPPVSVDVRGAQDAVPDLEPGYFLAVGRERGYKGIGTLIRAFAGLPGERLVVVGTEPSPTHPATVRAVGEVSEARLRWLYAHATALLSVAHEDFGLTPVEAAAFGTPALVLRAGGFLDSTHEGVSGLFIDDDTPSAVRQAVQNFPRTWDRDAVRRHAARFRPAEFHRRLREVIAAARERRRGA